MISFKANEKKLRVLIIAQYFYPDFGGSSTRAYNSALALKKQGCDVTVVTAFPHYPHGNIPREYVGKRLVQEQIMGINVIRTWIPSLPHSPIRNRIALNLTFILSSFFAMRLIKKPDIIFAMNPNLFSFYSAITYRLFFWRKIIRNIDDLWPEVFYDLGIVKSKLAMILLNMMAKVSYRYSSAIIPVSAGYVKTLLEKYKVPNEKITVIEHGVDLDKFRKTNRIVPRLNSKKIVMYSGALAVGYDFESILQAAKILEKEPINFIIRGTGAMFDLIASNIKRNQISNIQISNSLLPIQDLVNLMNSADIFILPMNSTGVIDQGLPTKISEYQSLGKPIICISEGEPGRYILRCQSGIVVRPGQPHELAETIMSLVRDEALCKKLGDNGYTHVINNLTLDKIGERLIAVIENSL